MVAVSVQNIIDCLQSVGIIAMVVAYGLLAKRLRFFEFRIKDCEHREKTWIPMKLSPEEGVDMFMTVGPCPRDIDEERDDVFSIRVRRQAPYEKDGGLARRIIRSLESLERTYGPYSLETLTNTDARRNLLRFGHASMPHKRNLREEP